MNNLTDLIQVSFYNEFILFMTYTIIYYKKIAIYVR